MKSFFVLGSLLFIIFCLCSCGRDAPPPTPEPTPVREYEFPDPLKSETTQVTDSAQTSTPEKYTSFASVTTAVSQVSEETSPVNSTAEPSVTENETAVQITEKASEEEKNVSGNETGTARSVSSARANSPVVIISAPTITSTTSAPNTTAIRTTTNTTSASRVTTTAVVTTKKDAPAFDSLVGLNAEGWYTADVLDVIQDHPGNITGMGTVLIRPCKSPPLCVSISPELCEDIIPGNAYCFHIYEQEIYAYQSELYRYNDRIGCKDLLITDKAWFDMVCLSEKGSCTFSDEDVDYELTYSETPIVDDFDELFYEVTTEGWFTATVVKKCPDYESGSDVESAALLQLFQCEPFYLKLSPGICAKIEENETYAFHVAKQKLTTGLSNLFVYEAGYISSDSIIENQALIDDVREPKIIEYGEDCWNVKYTR